LPAVDDRVGDGGGVLSLPCDADEESGIDLGGGDRGGLGGRGCGGRAAEEVAAATGVE